VADSSKVCFKPGAWNCLILHMLHFSYFRCICKPLHIV